MTVFVLSQVLVTLAICTDTLSFQCRSRQRILLFLLTSCVLIGLHFALLGKWTAVGLGLLAGSRYLICLRTTSRQLLLVYVSLILAVAILSFDGLLSIVAALGSLSTTIGSFSGDDKRLRLWMLAGGSFWLLHNVLAISPMAVVMEAMFVASNLVGLYRFHRRAMVSANS